jgi:hypothetical protein
MGEGYHRLGDMDEPEPLSPEQIAELKAIADAIPVRMR